MAKKSTPVFEKPKEPDFIRKLKQGLSGAEKDGERPSAALPLSEAPSREDELPTIVDVVNEEDLEKVRELHGLSANKDQIPNPTKDKETASKGQNRMAGLGVVSTDPKKRKKLAELRAKHEVADASSKLAIQAGRRPNIESMGPSRSTPAKAPGEKRKKMKIDVAYDDD